MTSHLPTAGQSRSRTRSYVLVVLVEMVVIAGLWLFGHYFGSQ